MKSILFILAITLSTIGYAQKSSKNKGNVPQMANSLHFGESLDFDAVTVKFVELVNDSRCPKNVSCIWAGEVVILVDVFENGKKLARKKMTFNARGQAQDVYVSEGLSISGFNISPYPVSGQKIAPEDYKMQLQIN